MPLEPKHAVTLSQAHQGNLEIDTLLLDSYRRLPEQRRAFYLSARKILSGSPSASITDPQIIEAAQKAGLPLISGPMLGDVSESGITVWFRPAVAETLTVQADAGTEDTKKQICVEVTEPGAPVRVRFADLQANARYTYRIVNGAGTALGHGSFHTAPKAAAKEPIRIAFGSCYHKIGLHNPNLMRLITQRGNLAMLLLGDIAADDRNARLNMHRSDYLLRDMSEPWRTFSANIPVYAGWDDHDYLNDDQSGLQKGAIGDADRNALRTLWQANWNNPQTTVEDRGIYFNTVIGDVEVIMLDTRSCRSWSQRGQRGSYLGDEQMQWLFSTLKASSARFIILTSGTMWSDFMSNAKDTWGSWDIPGREEIYRFIEENRIGGVLLLSGDRHGARGFHIKRPSGFAFHEFEAATLGGVNGPGAFAPDRSSQFFGYGAGLKAFGEFTFDMSRPDPEVTFRLIDEEEKELETHTFVCSELTPRDAARPAPVMDLSKNNADWNAAAWGDPPAAPVCGSDYRVRDGRQISVYTNGDSFAGGRLLLENNGRLILRTTTDADIISAHIILDNGSILQSGTSYQQRLSGTIHTLGNGYSLVRGSSVPTDSKRKLVVKSTLTGSGGFRVGDADTAAFEAAFNVDGSGFSGDWLVNNRAYLRMRGTDATAGFGRGNARVSAGGKLAIEKTCTAPGSLTIDRGASWVLHSDGSALQFGSVSIGGSPLEGGVHAFTDLIAEFPNEVTGAVGGTLTVAPPPGG
jgi:alkaline phosphatase D